MRIAFGGIDVESQKDALAQNGRLADRQGDNHSYPTAKDVLHWLGKPPRYVFHVALLLVIVALLWATSVPGFDFLLTSLSILALASLGALWLVRLMFYVWSRRKKGTHDSARLFLVAPLVVVLTVAAMATELPLRARWAQSEDSFSRAAQSAPPSTTATEWQSFDVASRIGSYKVRKASRVGDGVIFYESTGSVSDNAGFAYLPSGPFNELNTGFFERPKFESLGSGWYRWTASW